MEVDPEHRGSSGGSSDACRIFLLIGYHLRVSIINWVELNSQGNAQSIFRNCAKVVMSQQSPPSATPPSTAVVAKTLSWCRLVAGITGLTQVTSENGLLLPSWSDLSAHLGQQHHLDKPHFGGHTFNIEIKPGLNILRWTSLRYMDVYLQGLGNRLESPFTPGDKRALPRRHSKCGFSSSIIISDGGVCSSCMPLHSIEVAVAFIMGRHNLQNIMSWCI